jgi:hypothetical protein
MAMHHIDLYSLIDTDVFSHSTIKETVMKTAITEAASSTELLARIHLTASDRIRAEAALLRGEALADLLLGAARIVRGWVEHHQQHATDPRHLKSAG